MPLTWVVEVLLVRSDDRSRWERSVPLTFTAARAELQRHKRNGRAARLVELPAGAAPAQPAKEGAA